MIESITLFVIVTTIGIGASGEISNPLCDMGKCSGYYKLNTHKIKKPNIGVTKTDVELTIGPDEIDLLYIKRRWLSIYCYDGTFIDPNTGCYEKITLVNPTCTEAADWSKKNVCPTGWECSPDGDCVAGLANERCFDSTTIMDNVGPKALKWEGARFMRFPVHTCVSSWECNQFKITVPIFAKYDNNSNFQWVFYDKDNREHEINGNTKEEGITLPTEEKLCLSSNMKVRVENKEAECYSESIDNIKCIITSDGELNGIVFDVSNSGVGVLRNMKIEVLGQLLVPEDGTIKDINKNKYVTKKGSPTLITDRQRAVNVETAHELAINANILQMQSLYNILSLAQEVDELYNAIIHLIKSQSINDPLIVAKIVGGTRFAIKWNNEEVFEQCPCIQEKENPNSNCFGERMYNYGSYIQPEDKSKCFYMPSEDIINVTLVDSAKIHVETIKYLEPQTASSDSATWDALNEYRNQLISGDHTSHNYENLNDKISGILTSVGFNSAFQYFVYSTYVAAWVALLAVCFKQR